MFSGSGLDLDELDEMEEGRYEPSPHDRGKLSAKFKFTNEISNR